jgi:hypothetical protein
LRGGVLRHSRLHLASILTQILQSQCSSILPI